MRKVFLLLAGGAAALALAGIAIAATTTQTVTPATLSLTYWYFYDDVSDTPNTSQVPGKYEFVTGPGNPPAGVGSVRFQTIGAERWNMATSMYANTPLASITALKFNTYQPSTGQGANCANPSAECAVYLNFDVDFNTGLPGYQRRLVYVPAVNGTVLQNTWQEWDAAAPGALWTWSGCNNNCSIFPWPDGSTAQYRTWSDIIAAFPGIHINENPGSSQLLFRAGEPYPLGFIGHLDKATIGVNGNNIIYDFEPTLTPTSKDQCKNGGWQSFNTPKFKNQGDCIQFVNTGK
jgi:hypothetical protein